MHNGIVLMIKRLQVIFSKHDQPSHTSIGWLILIINDPYQLLCQYLGRISQQCRGRWGGESQLLRKAEEKP